MARPVYVDIPDTDVDIDSPGQENKVFSRLRNNATAQRFQIIATDLAEASTTSSTFVTLRAVLIFLPNLADYTGIARRIVSDFRIKVDGGGGTGTYRLQELGSSDVSNEVTTTSTTYVNAGPIIAVDPAWLTGDGALRTFNLQAKVTAGTAFLHSIARSSWHQDY